MKNVLKWIAVVISALFVAISQKQIFPFIIFLAATLIIMPPLRGTIEQKIPIFRFRGLTGLAWVGLYILGCLLWSPIDPHIKHLEAQKNVGELIQIVQKQEGNAYQAASALGNIGDKQAATPLIKAIENTTVSSSLRENAVEALGKIKEADAVKPLAKLLSSNSINTVTKAKAALRSITANNSLAPRQLMIDLIEVDKEPDAAKVAKDGLIAIGSPAVADLLEFLKVGDLPTKPIIMETLGGIGDPKAVKPLSAYLTDWAMKSDAGKALEKLNWQPKNDQERVHYWIALGRGGQLNQNWKMTKRVLIENVKSAKRPVIEYGLYAFITIGNRDVIPSLVEALHNQESKEMALAYLNCGEETLENAGTTWASDRGYEVIKTKDTSGRKVAWGTLKT